MRSKTITIKDIAKELGLSYSTVARALNESSKISQPIRKKVQEYAALHHYRPNVIAQGLKNRKSRSIGIILPSIPDSFFGDAINGLEAVSNERNYRIFITQSHESGERVLLNLERLRQSFVDGVLVSHTTEAKDVAVFEHLQKSGVPVVFFDRVTAAVQTHQVISDNIGGSYALTRHLIENGYKRIAYVACAPAISISQERIEGYRQALKEGGLPFEETYVKYCLSGGIVYAEIEAVLEELLGLPVPPDAILTGSDRITLGMFNALNSRHIPIPDQMALGGFSNFSLPHLFSPSLTVVRQSAFEMGRAAMGLLLDLIEAKHPVTDFKKIVLPSELIIGESTRAL